MLRGGGGGKATCLGRIQHSASLPRQSCQSVTAGLGEPWQTPPAARGKVRGGSSYTLGGWDLGDRPKRCEGNLTNCPTPAGVFAPFSDARHWAGRRAVGTGRTSPASPKFTWAPGYPCTVQCFTLPLVLLSNCPPVGAAARPEGIACKETELPLPVRGAGAAGRAAPREANASQRVTRDAGRLAGKTRHLPQRNWGGWLLPSPPPLRQTAEPLRAPVPRAQ